MRTNRPLPFRTEEGLVLEKILTEHIAVLLLPNLPVVLMVPPVIPFLKLSDDAGELLAKKTMIPPVLA